MVCNIQIKNELLWPAHINGKVHKQVCNDVVMHCFLNRTNAVQEQNIIEHCEIYMPDKIRLFKIVIYLLEY